MKRYFIFLLLLVLPQALFAANMFCTGEAKVCSLSDLRNSTSFFVKVGFFILLLGYFIGFFIEAANQYASNQFEGPAFFQFLKKRLSLFMFTVVIFLIVANFSKLLELLHADKSIKSMFGLIVGSW